MGIMIYLDVDFKKVEDKLWRDTFEEVTKLVEAYPFATLWYRDVMGRRILCYERTIPKKHEEIDGAKSLKIEGDMNTKIGGETFRLYSEKVCYKSAFNKEYGEVGVWGSKTQGEEYHRYIIAIGLLIEHRLKEAATLSGDITKEDIEVAQKFIYDSIGETVSPNREWNESSEDGYMSQKLLLSLFGGINMTKDKRCSENKLIIDSIYELPQYKCGMYLDEDIKQLIKKLLRISEEWSTKNNINFENMSNDELKHYILEESRKYNYKWIDEVIEYFAWTKDKYILSKLALLIGINVREGGQFRESEIKIWDEDEIMDLSEIHKVISSFLQNMDLLFWIRENKRFL